MGCDIHCYIEYQYDPQSGKWVGFGGRINPGRNYAMFTKLAGVRGDEREALIPPRGIPGDVGYDVVDDLTLYVVNHDTDNEGRCSADHAAKWLEDGSSKLWVDGKSVSGEPSLAVEGEITVFDGKNDLVGKRVTHPDWHSHSWLSTEEWGNAIRQVAKPAEEPEYYAILAAMRQLEAAGYKARVVFWFDN